MMTGTSVTDITMPKKKNQVQPRKTAAESMRTDFDGVEESPQPQSARGVKFGAKSSLAQFEKFNESISESKGDDDNDSKQSTVRNHR